MTVLSSVAWGLAAGAAGTTVLNLVTYLDMAARGRPASSTPQQTVEKGAVALHVEVPGDEETRQNRVAGIGPLLGIATGVGVGGLVGLARGWGWRPGTAVSSALAGLLALVGSNAPMSALGVTSLRSWSPTDWVSDAVPHLAYGVVTAAVLQGLDT